MQEQLPETPVGVRHPDWQEAGSGRWAKNLIVPEAFPSVLDMTDPKEPCS
ncbi:MAG: hypothetical protein ACO4AU_05825 [bacterium]|jgi:hypothetical protein